MSEAVTSETRSFSPGDNTQATYEARPLRVLVAASGTGGHLIPALHIIRALQELRPGSVIETIGAGKPLEEKIFVQNGFTRHVISAVGVKHRGVLGLLGSVARLPVGFFQCAALFRRFKPDVVVGVGGYVTVLPVIVARLMRIPTWIHEAELHPGLANALLGRFADRASVAFAETKLRGRVKSVFTGHPVRPELKRVDPRVISSVVPKRLLILGGSQGARGLDTVIPEIGEVLCSRGVEVVHQSRPENIELVMNSYRAAGVKASVVSFIDDMAGAYEWSDIVISRAGASSVAEVGAVNRPAIFVPYPFQQGTHQTDNAMALAAAGKALVVEETQPEFGRRLREALTTLLEQEAYSAMKSAPFEPRGLEAAAHIARGIVELVGP
jgi:UDP-N-acetylglucosamine--N-acetylmuramyl-(pentapeptide) pyrophosphoryl-undecaprenol N-acetylglucosamine transferase